MANSWTAGNKGKGVVDQHGKVHVWNADEFLLHNNYVDYVNRNSLQLLPQAYFYVNPEGGVHITKPNKKYDGPEKYQRALEQILKADSAFYEDKDNKENKWSFG